MVDRSGPDLCGDGLAFRAATPAAVGDLVRRCSPETLRRRFLRPAPLDPEMVLDRYLRYLLVGPPDGAAVLAVLGGVPVGLLTLVVSGRGQVEAALLVADACQRRGVATALLVGELSRPCWAGWTILATVDPDNVPVRHLLAGQRLGVGRLVDRDPSAWEFAIEVAPPPEV